MFHVSWRNLVAHKLRLVLTAVAVVLGVAFVTGTLTLTDTLSSTFDSLFGEANKGIAVAVQGKAPFTPGGGQSADRAPVPASVVPAIRALAGVAEVAGEVNGYAQLIDPATHKAIANGGAPALGVAWIDSRVLSPLHLSAGRPPAGAGEIAVDRATANSHHIAIGQSVTVLLKGPPRSERVAGIFSFGSTGNLAGATLTAFDSATAQRLIGTPGVYSQVDVASAPGVSQATLRSRVAAVVPDGFEAITGKQLTAQNANEVKDALKFFNVFLLVFAGISLFVGSFIIFNTFTMLVAQRTRELALLRAVGASRRQVTRAVLLEAVAVGVVGATLGLGVGVGLAFALRAVLGLFGIQLPSSGLVFQPRTAVVAYLIGIVITVAAAYSPARRAAKIPPVAAMRDDVALPGGSARRRAIIGGLLTAAGVAALATGMSGSGGQPGLLVGLGAAAVLRGVGTLSQFIAPPVVRVLGAPLPRLAGTSGRLARENALRNPRRTSATAAALMIGLTLVSAMSVMAASLAASAGRIIDSSVGADLVLTAGGFTGFSHSIADELRATPGVAAVTAFRQGPARIAGSVAQLQGADPGTVAQTLRIRMVAGSLAAMGKGELLVDDKTAANRHWHVGSTVAAEFVATGRQNLVVGGIYAQNLIAGSYLVSIDTFTRNFANSLDTVVAVKDAAGANPAAVRKAVEAVAAASPNVTVRDQTQFKANQRHQINQLLGLVTVLLALAVLIAMLGVVNTLALSVVERTREIGLLRAVGMSRRQLRRMVRWESVLICVFGGLLGVALGVGYGAALVRSLHSQGIDVLSIPGTKLVTYVVAAGVIGVFAAVWPARRAAKLDVLQAVATT